MAAHGSNVEVQVKNYERFTPLTVDWKGLSGGLTDVTAGDCIVAFSRRALYAIKAVIEACTDHRCGPPPCSLFLQNLILVCYR